MMSPDTPRSGREAFEEQRWRDAYSQLSSADRSGDLGPEGLERLATAAYMAGEYGESTDVWARAHGAFLDQGNVERAARSAFWLIYGLFNRGENARAGGWVARARRLLDDVDRTCVEQGYLLLHVAFEHVTKGEVRRAYALFSEAAAIGRRFADADLIALARHSLGRVRIRMGEVRDGVRLLDEAMATLEAEALSPLVAGDVYCSVIEGCMEICDLGRAQEWTAALGDWWAAQPDLMPFTGQCLVHRAEILQLHGAWSDAVEAAEQACERLTQGSGEPAAGEAFYRRGELYRLRGEFDRAEAAYRAADTWGRTPTPGVARLRLFQGRTEVAKAAIRRAVDEAQDRATRWRLMPADVDISLAAGDKSGARAAADELEAIAGALEAPYLDALAEHARGSVLLAEGRAAQALPFLRRAWRTWTALPAPYETARVRVVIARACREVGDEATAEMELDAARSVFQRLEASPDLKRIARSSDASTAERPGGLTEREVEVLHHVAAGKTNQEIASDLFISEKTVARHMSNIFGKLNVPNRAAATAYAYENGLL